MLSIEEPFNFVLLLVQLTSPAFCAKKKFTIFNFRRLKKDVRIGLPAGWRKEVGEKRCFMIGSVYFCSDWATTPILENITDSFGDIERVKNGTMVVIWSGKHLSNHICLSTSYQCQ